MIDEFHDFVAVAMGFCCGCVFFTLLAWAAIRKGR